MGRKPKVKSHKRNGKDVTAETQAAKPSDVKPQIAKGKLLTLLSKARTTKTDTRSISGQLGQAVADAVENNHLHRKAFNIVKGLDAMRSDPEKLADTLDALSLYLDLSGLNDVAAKVMRLPLDEREEAEDDEDNDNDEERGDAAEMQQAAE